MSAGPAFLDPAAPVASALRALRRERGLGLTEAARRAGLSPGTLSQWEAGGHLPTGPRLDRVLVALDAPPRLRARLLAEADPRHARFALADDPLGPPLGIGDVLRGLRLRQGVRQTELARALGVAQGTVAKWEAGDNPIATDDLARALTVLRATPEERRLALTAAPGTTADADEDPWRRIERIDRMPYALQEVAYLLQERDLWPQALRDPQAERALVATLSVRAHLYVLASRHGEAAALARRALVLARTGGYWEELHPCVGALAGPEPGSARLKGELLGALDARLGGPLRLYFEAAGSLGAARGKAALLNELAHRAPDPRGRFFAVPPEEIEIQFAMRVARRDPDRALETLARLVAAYPDYPISPLHHVLTVPYIDARLASGERDSPELRAAIARHASRSDIPRTPGTLARWNRTLARRSRV